MTASAPPVCIGVEAAADLSSVQFHVVRVVSNNAVNVASQNSVMRAVGVLQDTPNAATRAARVAVDGESFVIAGASYAAGVPVTHNSSGRAIAATSGLCVIGYALEAAVADGDMVRILLRSPALCQV
jgi:ribosomal protein S12